MRHRALLEHYGSLPRAGFPRVHSCYGETTWSGEERRGATEALLQLQRRVLTGARRDVAYTLNHINASAAEIPNPPLPEVPVDSPRPRFTPKMRHDCSKRVEMTQNPLANLSLARVCKMSARFPSSVSMSRPLRFIPEGGALVEVTLRTIHSRFLLLPG